MVIRQDIYGNKHPTSEKNPINGVSRASGKFVRKHTLSMGAMWMGGYWILRILASKTKIATIPGCQHTSKEIDSDPNACTSGPNSGSREPAVAVRPIRPILALKRQDSTLSL